MRKTEDQLTPNDLSDLLAELDDVLMSSELGEAYWEDILRDMEDVCNAEK